ncbi:hypothetical protein M409DRAFT_36165 [Zasmidium cellare ATCC 36951]|uniref:Heterokaryon incompatibility domain-containing protein n=1 Tax=Zasmidium cellare ATCC 36951 TaxID=1080233 RepID=A0A6A6CTW4_ZASCE|nr:uncharacterized protein M409DRAFT_36165 [Zasmidium cellare ATCC 36951]KAF2169272.1 hypothetical protein M409DRAFT_36165 [Zasmidium cellare ATCC 36951]
MKIEKACDQAKRDGHTWVWIDTCCIDKESSADLSEVVNSMYRWYADATVCYVYLADVTIESHRRGDIHKLPQDVDYLRLKFAAGRWFTRGWTLQESIAPKEVRFYDSEWFFITTKTQSTAALAKVSGIDEIVLRRSYQAKHFSVATRFSWAAKRQTTRVEDEAYSLVGLFDVNMPMIYGEGQKAFIRLQEEIIKT